MKNIIYIILIAFALTACNGKPANEEGRNPANAPKPATEMGRTPSTAPNPDPTNPQLFIVDGKYIVVDQEPLQFILTEGKNEPVTITWHLPKGGGYRFVKEGIRVARCEEDAKERKEQSKCSEIKNDASGDIVNCGPTADATEYQCTNLRKTIGTFKYTITVEKDGIQLRPLDPTGSNGTH
jgi:hypothetical protein